MPRYGREDEENGRLAAAEALRTEASLAEDGIKTMAAPSSAASTPYSSVAQLPAPPAASTLRGDDQAQDAKAGDRLALSCRYKLEGQPAGALFFFQGTRVGA